MEELRLNASVELNRRVYADERAQRGEAERKEMEDRLARMEKERGLLSKQLSKALGDRSAAEQELRA